MRGDYLFRLSRAVRWCLPPAEAAEVLEDYRDLIEQESRCEEELRRDLGSPWSAARQLVQPKAYQRWVTVFAVLAACILLPAVLPLLSELSGIVIFRFHTYGVDLLWWFISLCDKVIPFRGGLLLTGMALALAWFRRGKGEDKCRTLPKGVMPLLLLLLMGMAFQWVNAWILLNEPVKVWEWLTSEIVKALRLAMTLDMFSMGIIGMFALVKARMADRRWRAVYILALAGSILGLSIFAFWTRMDVSFSDTGWQTSILLRYIAITALGLVGMGGSLC
ncbi:MAG: hypothetical protein HFG10_00265 [Oscillibacter sp.]|nr:hypothetical protein [Oscillibacter sp.]